MIELLNLIECVDHTNDEKMYWLDFAVRNYLFMQRHEFLGKADKHSATLYKHGTTGETLPVYVPLYTRSRDALKSIRPVAEGGWWRWEISTGNGYNHCEFTRFRDFGTRQTPYLATEELVELHAIIQAIAHERGEK